MKRRKLTNVRHQMIKQKTNDGQNDQRNESQLRLLFEKCSDIYFQHVKFNHFEALTIYCPGMVDSSLITERVFPAFEEILQYSDVSLFSEEKNLELIPVPNVSIVTSTEETIFLTFSGHILIYFQSINVLLAVNIAKVPKRNIAENSMEITIKGPRDNLIEDITTNMALLRKRLPTNSLRSEQLTIGRRSKTAVNIVYIDDIAVNDMVNQVRSRLTNIDIDAIYNGKQLIELLEKKSFIFPVFDYSARPDWIVKSLLSGRIILLIDNIAYAIVMPANLFSLLKGAEDSENPFLFASFERLLRVIGIAIATFLPGFWVAITTFHPNQLPLTLLSTVIETRKGIPIPSGVEAFLMLLMFELFREAGVRLPSGVGQTLSVIGGLIIGDAAIRSGLTSPAMLVVISASSVATFTLVNQSLVGGISLLRYFVLLTSSFFGLFGYFLSGFAILLYMANIRVLGVPYLAMATRISLMNILKSVFHLPAKMEKTRPNMFDSADRTREE